MAVRLPKTKKSYHSMAVPREEATTTSQRELDSADLEG